MGLSGILRPEDGYAAAILKWRDEHITEKSLSSTYLNVAGVMRVRTSSKRRARLPRNRLIERRRVCFVDDLLGLDFVRDISLQFRSIKEKDEEDEWPERTSSLTPRFR